MITKGYKRVGDHRVRDDTRKNSWVVGSTGSTRDVSRKTDVLTWLVRVKV